LRSAEDPNKALGEIAHQLKGIGGSSSTQLRASSSVHTG